MNAGGILWELHTIVADVLAQSGAGRAADPIAALVVERIADRLGGQGHYIPANGDARRIRRDLAVLEAFDGTNRAAVCQRFGINERTLYRIVRRTRVYVRNN